MLPQDMFGVAVRTTGLWIILYGIYALIHAMTWLLSYDHAPATAADTKASDKKCAEPPEKNAPKYGRAYFFWGTVLVFMGAVLLIMADAIVWMSYGP